MSTGDPAYDDEPEAAQGGGPQVDYDAALRHLVEDVQQNDGDTLCCGVDMFDVMQGGGALTDDPDEVTCPASAEPDLIGPEIAVGPPTADEARPPTAAEIEAGMRAYARAAQAESSTHENHDGDPRFDVERNVVICGCGEAIDEGPDGSGYRSVTAPENMPDRIAADPVLSDLPPIDPRRPYTPQDLERAILETTRRLDLGLALEVQWIEVMHKAQHAYDVAQARARLRANGRAQDQRDAQVMVATEREANDLAEARMRCAVLKSAMHTLRSVLSGYQSSARSVGVLAQAGGGDGGRPYRREQGSYAGPLT